MLEIIKVWLEVSVDKYEGDDLDVWLAKSAQVRDRFGRRAAAWYMRSSFWLGWYMGYVRSWLKFNGRVARLHRVDTDTSQMWVDEVLG